MVGMLSPIMSKIVREEENYPSPSAKTKLNKAIGKYKLLSKVKTWDDHADDVLFALSDLLVARGEEEDYKEALMYYNKIISKSKNKVLVGRSMIGKAELVIAGIAKMSEEEAIKLCKDGVNLLKGKNDEFFSAKGIAVEAELLVKKGQKSDIKSAEKLFSKLIKDKKAPPYFRARALVGKAELALYFGIDSISNAIKMCEECINLLIDRPLDYFAVKAKVIEAELLARRGAPTDLQKAEQLCQKIIISPVHKDLSARAKLVFAEVSKKEKAKKMYEEVLEQDGLDPYLIEKAKIIAQHAKRSFN